MFIKSQNGFTLCNMTNIICLHIQRSSYESAIVAMPLLGIKSHWDLTLPASAAKKFCTSSKQNYRTNAILQTYSIMQLLQAFLVSVWRILYLPCRKSRKMSPHSFLWGEKERNIYYEQNYQFHKPGSSWIFQWIGRLYRISANHSRYFGRLQYLCTRYGNIHFGGNRPRFFRIFLCFGKIHHFARRSHLFNLHVINPKMLYIR